MKKRYNLLKNFFHRKKEEGKQLKVVINIKNKSKEPFPEEIKQKLSNLHTYYPTTVLVNDQNAGMELSYVADTKNYIDNKLKELVTANMQNTANLLSLMPLSTQAEMIKNDTNRILESEVTQ